MPETMPTTDPYSLLSPEAFADPYPIYRRLREESPVYWSEALGGWLITRYRDVAAALQDPRFSLGDGVATMFDRLPESLRDELRPLKRHLSMWMGTLDPPEHTRLRSLLNRGFTPRLIESLRPFTQAMTDELLDAVQDTGRCDLVQDLAVPLPATVIATMLGTPPEECDLFRKWSSDLTAFLGFGLFDVEVMRRAQATVIEMTEYLAGLIRQQRSHPAQPNLISTLLAAEAQGSIVNEEELLANCVLLLFAGHETTTILIGNSMLALLQHPEQLRQLRDQPELGVPAVEEFLRYDSPVQMVRRSAREDVELHGQLIKQGHLVWLVLGAANRDPQQFPDPERLDITRRENRQLAFGAGIHYCIGAALSRIEGQVAVSTLLRRLPELRLDAEGIQRLHNPTARSLKSLPVSFRVQARPVAATQTSST